MASVQAASPSLTVTSNAKIIRAKCAAEFVLKHAESFDTSIEGLAFEGQYEILVGFTGVQQTIFILLSNDFPRTARKTAKKLNWITTHFQCTLYTPSRIICLEDGSWVQRDQPGTKQPFSLGKWLPHRSSPSVTGDPEQYPLEDAHAGPSSTERSGTLSFTTNGKDQPSSSGHSSLHNSDGGEGGGGGGGGDSIPSSGHSSRHSSEGGAGGGGGGGDSIPSSGNSSHNSDGEEGGGGGEPVPSVFLIDGKQDEMRRVNITGHSGINGFSGGAKVLNLHFHFDIQIQTCDNPKAKPYRAKGHTSVFNRAWTEVNIQEFSLSIDNPDRQLKGQNQIASHFIQECRLFVGSTPLEAYPMSCSHVGTTMSKPLRVRTGHTKGEKISMSAGPKPHGDLEGTLTKNDEIEVERDSWLHFAKQCPDEPHKRTLNSDVYKQRRIDAMVDTNVTFRPGPVTIIDYLNVRPSSGEEKKVHFAMETLYSSLPGNDPRSWLKNHFNRANRKTPLHAELSHHFEFEVNPADIPVGFHKTIRISPPLYADVDTSTLRSGLPQHSFQEMSSQELTSTITFEQSIEGTISRKRKNPVKWIREKIKKPLDRYRHR